MVAGLCEEGWALAWLGWLEEGPTHVHRGSPDDPSTKAARLRGVSSSIHLCHATTHVPTLNSQAWKPGPRSARRSSRGLLDGWMDVSAPGRPTLAGSAPAGAAGTAAC